MDISRSRPDNLNDAVKCLIAAWVEQAEDHNLSRQSRRLLLELAQELEDTRKEWEE